MNAIEPYSGGGGMLRRDAQRSGRAISRRVASGQVREADADLATGVAIAKVQSHTAVTAAGMTDVARIAQAQQQLELMTPAAAGRLAMLADSHVLGIVDVQADHLRALRRV